MELVSVEKIVEIDSYIGNFIILIVKFKFMYKLG